MALSGWKTSFLAATLLALALSPAWLPGNSPGMVALAIFAFFSKLCHQRADRSLLIFGVRTAVCIRCLGVYAGAAIGSLCRLNYRSALRCLGAALAVNCLDVATESFGLHANMPLARFLIGSTLGAAVGAMLSLNHLTPESRTRSGTRPALR